MLTVQTTAFIIHFKLSDHLKCKQLINSCTLEKVIHFVFFFGTPLNSRYLTEAILFCCLFSSDFQWNITFRKPPMLPSSGKESTYLIDPLGGAL
jgi:hypothetical protein